MKYSILTYQVIAIISFSILSVVQVFLVFNTYELENERYRFAEKSSLNEYYSKIITNDKLFPGGQYIIDTILNRNIPRLGELYKNDRPAFEIEKQKVCDSVFTELRKHETVGTILSDYKQQKNIKDSLDYALAIESLDLLLEEDNYISLYNKKQKYSLVRAEYQLPEGMRVGGYLKNTNKQNRTTGLSISIPIPGTYKIVFSLYVDTHNRVQEVISKMMPVLTLSLMSLLVNVGLFYITFRNWLRQKKLSEMKTDFINSITHEFNTPIATIAVANRSLQNDKIIDRKENIHSLSGVIQRQTSRLQKLFGQVLELTRLNELTLQKEAYSINSLLDEILLDYHLNLSDKEVKLSLHKEANNDTVFLDRFYFTTMLLNIIDNGIKYNNRKIKEITVSTSNNKKNIQISIQDNGNGMTEETKENIFKKFYRNKENEQEQATGLGLGLYYVKQSADAHGWSLFVDSTPGEGTTFIITIPVQ
ncbi:MAG: HAMP domain-containing histidine kinase [Chitinophagaceae bacterium]|nr:HAMP domain-containing histidine kinase [Chitinophagaceae bacterium]